jgi:hypothetical protein
MMPVNGDADAQAKAAKEAKAAEMKAQKAAAKQAAQQKAAETTTVTSQNGDNPAQAKAREALANSLFNMSADTPVTPVTPATSATSASQPKQTMVVTPMPAPEVKTVIASPIGMAPPLPISQEKQQKLQALLGKYRADQVSPDEYQKQRAAILAEP